MQINTLIPFLFLSICDDQINPNNYLFKNNNEQSKIFAYTVITYLLPIASAWLEQSVFGSKDVQPLYVNNCKQYIQYISDGVVVSYLVVLKITHFVFVLRNTMTATRITLVCYILAKH